MGSASARERSGVAERPEAPCRTRLSLVTQAAGSTLDLTSIVNMAAKKSIAL
jgi:hypothetical protein